MPKRCGVLLSTLCLLLCCDTVLGDIRLPPRARKITSPDGLWGISLGPSDVSKDIAFGRLFYIQLDGSEQDIWKQNLVNDPDRVLVSGYPMRAYSDVFADPDTPIVVHVVTVDSLGHLGGKESIVIYGKDVKEIRKCALSELLSEREIKEKISVRALEYAADFRIMEETQLLVEFDWGKKCVIDLPTAKVWNPERLNKALSRDDLAEIHRAFSALRCPKQLHKEVLPGLIAALSHEQIQVRHEACSLIERLGRRAEAAVEPLLERLKHDDANGSSMKVAAAQALGRMGPAAAVAIPELEKFAANVDSAYEREIVEQAIRRIRSKPD